MSLRALLVSALTLALLGIGCDSFPPTSVDDDDSADDDDDDGDDDDDLGDDDSAEDPCDGASPTEPCCTDPLPTIRVGSCDLPEGQEFTGFFTSWELGSSQFVTNDQQSFEFQVDGTVTSFAMLPDLQAAGEVSLVQSGGCTPMQTLDNALYVYRGPQGSEELVLLTGNVSSVELGGWNLDSPSNTASCLARPGDACNEFLHNRAVYVDRGGQDSWTLYQGTEALIEGHDVLINEARSGSGEYLCMEGPRELDNWVIVPHVEG